MDRDSLCSITAPPTFTPAPGRFRFDSNNYLVDASTGYRVQRTGSEGLAEGFQSSANDDIQIPYGVSLPAKATTQISFSGNLSADEATPTQNVISSGLAYTVGGQAANSSTTLTSLDQATNLTAGDEIVISGTQADGTAVASTDFDIFNSDGSSKTLGDLATAIGNLFPESTVSISNGQIQVTDNTAGYSQTNVNLAFSVATDDSLTVPASFAVNSASARTR